MSAFNSEHEHKNQSVISTASHTVSAVPETEAVIRLSGVSKVYNLYRNKKDRLKEALHPRRKKYHKEFYALRNIDLEVNKGEVLGIVGRNGSGKSTLLKTIAGVLTPTIGNVKTHGKIIPLLELGAGFNPEFTGMENIFFYCSLLGYRKEEIDNFLDEILEFAEIGDFIHQPLKTYSSGMSARLAFAVSVIVEPDILILDEVLSVGDVLFRRKCFARMEKFFKGGKTVLFVSHNTNSINELCTRAVLLDSGENILVGPAKQVTMYYEKMIFAKKENVQNIRNEILELNTTNTAEACSSGNISKNVSGTNDCARKNEPAMTSSELQQKAYYLKDLKPKSTLECKEYNVDIFDVKITTPEGEKVNCLLTGDKYIYSFKVKFGIPASDVVMALMIKDEKGKVLYHASNKYMNDFIPVVEINDIYEVKFEFECNLLQGMFYTNAGVGTFSTAGITQFNRIIDAFVFQVLPSERNQKGMGFVFFNDTFEVSKI